jgi:hypothetical protein
MKVLVHNSKTKLFYVAVDHWTVDRKQARDFGQVEIAIQTCQKQRITGVEVIVDLDDGFNDLVLPIRGVVRPGTDRQKGD